MELESFMTWVGGLFKQGVTAVCVHPLPLLQLSCTYISVEVRLSML